MATATPPKTTTLPSPAAAAECQTRDGTSAHSTRRHVRTSTSYA